MVQRWMGWIVSGPVKREMRKKLNERWKKLFSKIQEQLVLYKSYASFAMKVPRTDSIALIWR
jgi:hypothetical protein